MTLRSPVITRTWPRDPTGIAATAQAGVQGTLLTTNLRAIDKFFAAPGEAPRYDYANPQRRDFHASLQSVPLNLLETTLQPVVTAGIAIDGTAAAFSSGAGLSSQTVVLTTTNAGDIIIIGTSCVGAHTVSSITDTAGLTWTLRKAIIASAVHHLEEWWAVAPSPLVGDSITVNLSSAPVLNWDISAFGVTNGNTSVPFDVNGSLPASSTFGGTTVSTTNPNTMLLGFLETSGSLPTGWTLLFDDPAEAYLVMYQVVSTAQSGTTVDDSGGSSSGSIGDALQALGAPASPRQAYDQPNPRGTAHPVDLRTFLNAVELPLLRQDKFFGAAGEAPRYDYPNPRGAVPASDLRTFTNSVELSLLGKDKFFGAAGEPPHYDYPNPRAPSRAIDLLTLLVDLLQTTLGGVVQPPFFLLDWPNPRSATYPSDLRTFLNAVELQLVGRDTFFGAAGQAPPNRDWPVPRGAVYPSDLRTFLNAVELQLLGNDTFFGAAGESPRYDYPNPRGPAHPSDLRSFVQTVVLELLSKDQFYGAPGQPAPNNDWPVPRGAAYPSDLRTFLLDLLQTTLGIIPPPPFAMLDWPVPRSPTYPSDLRTFLNAVELQLVGQDAFFAAPGEAPRYDYPNPRGPAHPADLRTFLQSMVLELLSQDKFYGAAGQPAPNYDWPVPRGAVFPSDLRTFLLDLLQTTLGIIPPPPFSMLDWPNPRGATYSSDLRTFVHALVIELLGQDKFFGAPGQSPANLDWIVPKGAQFPVDLRTLIVSLLQSTLTIIPAPFAELDWPNPRSPTYPAELRTFLRAVELELLSQDKFYGAPGQPPARGDQPNPRGPLYPNTFGTHTEQVNLELYGQDTFYGAPGQPPTRGDQPNPRGPRPTTDWLSIATSFTILKNLYRIINRPKLSATKIQPTLLGTETPIGLKGEVDE